MSKAAIKNELAELKAKLNPEEKHFAISGDISGLDDPHGFLNGSVLYMDCCKGEWTSHYEAISTEEELRSNKAYYDKLLSDRHNKFMQDPKHPFHSLESFVEFHRCKCGKHGADGKQPFLGENQNNG